MEFSGIAGLYWTMDNTMESTQVEKSQKNMTDGIFWDDLYEVW